eukprot:TRINITY_DN30234_c0_g1_i1.p1 TRINITY_DN30234_c0_g1~~TRINITY_DN30234_c0_g1_i1.p1  ORF type:complete len:687 (+),score=61.04 TRINITY_DN30234_c0_g1_i1:134-2194(+)
MLKCLDDAEDLSGCLGATGSHISVVAGVHPEMKQLSSRQADGTTSGAPGWTVHSTVSLWSSISRQSPAVLIGAPQSSSCSVESRLTKACQATCTETEPTGILTGQFAERRQFCAARWVAAWTGLTLLVLAAAFASPLMFDESCYSDELRDLNHICPCFLALGLATSYGKLRRMRSRASLWTQRYAASFFVYAVFWLIRSWLWALCPADKFEKSIHRVLVACAAYGLNATYTFCQLCLACVSLLRLRWMGSPHQAWQAACLFKLALCVGVPGSLLEVLCRRFLEDKNLHLVARSLVFAGVLLFLAFQGRVFSALLQAGRSALKEAHRTEKLSEQARAALLTASAVALSSSTSVVIMLYAAVPPPNPMSFLSVKGWFFHCLLTLDLSTDVFLAIACSGLITAAADQELNFKIAGDLVEAARRRKVLATLKEAARAVTGPSVSLAALFEGKDPEDLLETAVERFRCISWETLRRHPYLILGGGPLDGESVAKDFYELSEPCKLSRCDAFFSHSWHDDAWEKWRSLSEWCTEFSEAHGRPPHLWFDKVCIDQTDIQTDLQCLPIFLAGCNSLLVFCGKTYTSRLWCCVELFVFMKMALDFSHEIHVRRIVEDDDSRAEVASSWATFDVRACHCFLPEDKQRILECIEKDHGADGFNEYIRRLASDLFQRPTENQDERGVHDQRNPSVLSI